MDYIYLSQMEFYGFHGVLPEEKKLGQRFIVDVKLQLDLKKAGKTDRLEESVNYADVFETCKEVVEGRTFNLIETVAENIADELLSRFKKIQICTVKVIKPDPPISGHYQSVAVEITRQR